MGFLRPLRLIYVQVLIAVALGVLVGALWPAIGVQLKPLSDGFIKLIKMIIAPAIFCTVMVGIARVSDLTRFGRVGLKALIYFEVISTLALLVGLAVGELIHPGVGFTAAPPTAADLKTVAGYVDKAHHADTVADFFLNIIPDSFFTPFAEGSLLQVLLIAILSGFGCARLGETGEAITNVVEKAGELFFAIINILVKLAPVGAFAAMGFTIGKYGLMVLLQLGTLVATFYLTSILFVVLVLGLVARLAGFSIFRFVAYIKEELLIVLGTSSSESVLPQMMRRLTALGAGKGTVGLVIPTGYSFNLDGTNIYMTLAILFLAQATNTHLSVAQIATILGVAMLTSKGASGVTGAGYITLAATLFAVPDIPIVSLAFILGVDRFMSECRALTNLVGNGVATLVVARWEKDLDVETLQAELRKGPSPLVPAAEPTPVAA